MSAWRTAATTVKHVWEGARHDDCCRESMDKGDRRLEIPKVLVPEKARDSETVCGVAHQGN